MNCIMQTLSYQTNVSVTDTMEDVRKNKDRDQVVDYIQHEVITEKKVIFGFLLKVSFGVDSFCRLSPSKMFAKS